MVPFNYTDFQAETIALVEKGFISRRRIDDAVRRILRVKFMMGLFEHPYGDRSLAGNVGSEEHRVLAREAVRKSLVLLKNGKSGGKPLLPLNKNARKILVAGTHANDVGNLCGGWTITWQGSPGNITKGNDLGTH
jgi:beta-glucosidase-like glycosyl hydrolase